MEGTKEGVGNLRMSQGPPKVSNGTLVLGVGRTNISSQEGRTAASSQLASLWQFSHCILYGTFGFRA